jgi:dienelactone hydrolase
MSFPLLGVQAQSDLPPGSAAFTTVEFRSIDGLTVTADLYETGDRSDPMVILFHQSASSRGEYRAIGPVLVENGFNALAVDLRWGHQDFWNMVANETAARYGTKAIMDEIDAGRMERLWPTLDLSYLDMLSALDWVGMNDFSGKRIVSGSSISAMQVFDLPHDRAVDGIMSFSPGEYLRSDSLRAQRWAADLSVPVFVAAGEDEESLSKPIFDAVGTPAKTFYQATIGPHGASMLFQADENLAAMLAFLKSFRKPETVSFESEDGITLHGEFYLTEPTGPTILLFHQGGSNARAEYDVIAPKLIWAGYNLVAIDQRRGGSRLGGVNRTVEGVGDADFSYCQVYPDLVAALRFAEGKTSGPFIAWGSSYSATLALQLAAKERAISAVLAFSPASGEPMAECQPLEYAGQTKAPILVFRPPAELHLPSVAEQWQEFEKMGVNLFVPQNGVHGSSMLNPIRVRADVEPTWQVVMDFLSENVR